jgi:hypothetical protein
LAVAKIVVDTEEPIALIGTQQVRIHFLEFGLLSQAVLFVLSYRSG